MSRVFSLVAFFILLDLGFISLTVPGQGFFKDKTIDPAVKKFCLPLDNQGNTVNCYVTWLPESRQAVIVDPGAPAAAILEFISARHLKVLAILNTHGHADHCAGDCFLAAKLSVPIYLHQSDLTKVSRMIGPNCPLSFYPEDHHLVLDGWEIEIIPTPGHTPGSVCLRIGEILFSGDTLFAGSIGKAEGNNRSKRQANLQLEVQNIRLRLLTLPTTTRVFPGHGSTTTIGSEKAFNPYLVQ